MQSRPPTFTLDCRPVCISYTPMGLTFLFLPKQLLKISTQPRFTIANMNAAPPETIQPWAPNMVYRARRHKSLTPTLCEKFIEQQVFPFYRTYLPQGGPNYDYGPMMERATRFVTYIVSDKQPRLPKVITPTTSRTYSARTPTSATRCSQCSRTRQAQIRWLPRPSRTANSPASSRSSQTSSGPASTN